MGNRTATLVILSALLVPAQGLGEPRQGDPTFEAQRAARVDALEAFKTSMAEPFQIERPERFQVFELSVIQTNIPVGQRIGDYNPPGLLGPCYAQGDDSIGFDAARDALDHVDLYDAFHDVMRRGGYRLAADPSALFSEEPRDETAAYKIGAEIIAADFDVCQDWTFWNPFDDDDGQWLGTLRLTVVWHVYNAKRRETVEAITLDGRALLEESDEQARDIVVRKAFTDAARHLGQSHSFQMAVARASQPLTRIVPNGADAWTIALEPLSDLEIGLSGERVVDSTVTIITGEGHGSGFFISEDGLILTNEHVVEAADRVRVRLINGVEVEAEVLARHRGRDVALLRAGLARSLALPLRLEAPGLGETVYSVGAPLDEELSGTIRQGIVSQMRVHEDYLWIQSDVAVNGGNSGGPLVDRHGNVVGVTSWGFLGEVGEDAGLNFFIPIADALEKLGVEVTQVASY